MNDLLPLENTHRQIAIFYLNTPTRNREILNPHKSDTLRQLRVSGVWGVEKRQVDQDQDKAGSEAVFGCCAWGTYCEVKLRSRSSNEMRNRNLYFIVRGVVRFIVYIQQFFLFADVNECKDDPACLFAIFSCAITYEFEHPKAKVFWILVLCAQGGFPSSASAHSPSLELSFHRFMMVACSWNLGKLDCQQTPILRAIEKSWISDCCSWNLRQKHDSANCKETRQVNKNLKLGVSFPKNCNKAPWRFFLAALLLLKRSGLLSHSAIIAVVVTVDSTRHSPTSPAQNTKCYACTDPLMGLMHWWCNAGGASKPLSALVEHF